jgi:transcriptional regulator with GAF, ATPase, and Fis domain
VRLAEHVAGSEATILLTGDTGTGKDLLARHIHHVSGRTGRFVAINAAAIPNSMVESELFGHRKGSYTGADEDRVGLLESAQDGTFFLNEISSATPEFQAKLLEALETRQIRRLGENTPRPVNFRLIAATNRDLAQCVRDNTFRLDLYHRLNEVCLNLPSLAERPEDIPELVRHFLAELGFAPTGAHDEARVRDLGDTLSGHLWSGNVRELRNEIRRLWLESDRDVRAMKEAARRMKPQSEKEALILALNESGWNRREAGRRLGVTEGTVRYRMRKHGINGEEHAPWGNK